MNGALPARSVQALARVHPIPPLSASSIEAYTWHEAAGIGQVAAIADPRHSLSLADLRAGRRAVLNARRTGI